MPESAATDSEAFLNLLYGEEQGWVYAPVKEVSGLFNKQYRFEWPRQRQDVIKHILDRSMDGNVYVSPALYQTNANATKENVLGANVVWADFDGGVPTSAELALAKVPEPSVRVESSEGREHWYWKLEQFETDTKTLEDVNRSIAYAFDGADLSGWNMNKLLRPPGSVNHKPERDLAVSRVVKVKDKRYKVTEAFSAMTRVESVSFDKTALLALGSTKKFWPLVHAYTWSIEEMNVLYKKPEAGLKTVKRRGHLLYRLAAIGAEKGMDNLEIYSLIAGVDKQPHWRKFSDRPTFEADYAAIIDKVRKKHPYQSEAEQAQGFQLKSFLAHFEPEVNQDWLLDGYLVAKSINLIMGKSASGKTMLALAIARALVLKKNILHWENKLERGQRIIYFSYEMNEVENAKRFSVWVEHLSQDEISVIENDFKIVYPGDSPAKFHVAGDQERIKALIEQLKPDGIIIDSASMSMAPHMTDEEALRRSMEFIRALCKRYDLYAFIIHHPRKDPPGTKTRYDDTDGSHGAQVVINQSTTAINITSVGDPNAPMLEDPEDESAPKKLVVNLNWRKFRLGATPSGFHAELAPDLTFQRTAIATEYVERKALTAGTSKPTAALPASRTAPSGDILARLAEENRNGRSDRKKRPDASF